MNNIQLLKDIHKGEDIWLLLAGSSMDYVNKSFFENKITIGQNQIYKLFPCSYVLMKDCNEYPRFTESIKQLAKLDIPLLYAKHLGGTIRNEINVVDYSNSYCFNHNDRVTLLNEELLTLDSNSIITSRSTVTSLMHMACYMGAKNIILCGHDCGYINDNLYATGYNESNWTSAGNWPGIDAFLGKLEKESVLVRDYLVKRYDVNIYSLNPFINLSLEGNVFKAC